MPRPVTAISWIAPIGLPRPRNTGVPKKPRLTLADLSAYFEGASEKELTEAALVLALEAHTRLARTAVAS